MLRSMAAKLVLVLVFALAGAVLSGCASTSAPPAGGAVAPLPTGAYRLDNGDRVRVVVFSHEDLSGEFQVDGTGRFAMPLIGAVDAKGLTTRELETKIQQMYTDGQYLVQPQVNVSVLNFRPFYIMGEVNRPGSYEYVDGMSVLQAVSLAGGFTYRAAQGDVTIKRGGSGATAVPVGPDQQVAPGDIIEVPERFF